MRESWYQEAGNVADIQTIMERLVHRFHCTRPPDCSASDFCSSKNHATANRYHSRFKQRSAEVAECASGANPAAIWSGVVQEPTRVSRWPGRYSSDAANKRASARTSRTL